MTLLKIAHEFSGMTGTKVGTPHWPETRVIYEVLPFWLHTGASMQRPSCTTSSGMSEIIVDEVVDVDNTFANNQVYNLTTC